MTWIDAHHHWCPPRRPAYPWEYVPPRYYPTWPHSYPNPLTEQDIRRIIREEIGR